MKQDWIKQCLTLSHQPADFYSGARKILQNVHFSLTPHDDLILKDCGFTRSKLRMLERNYLVQESIDAALELWKGRVARGKYGSVGFTTYGHYVKGGGHRSHFVEINKKRKEGADYKPSRSSVMGPCIQSVIITLNNDKSVVVDIPYRTTELYKKFGADLVFINDTLLPPFNIKPTHINFHFANVTMHSMYFITIIPHLPDPIAELEKLKKKDPFFWKWVVKWTARYLCPEHLRGIEKFSQAMRTRKDGLERIDKKTMKVLQRYLRDNHPGFRNEYQDPDEEEVE